MIKTSLIILTLFGAIAIAIAAGREWLYLQREDPNALWRIAQLCARDQAANHMPAPCLAVDLPAGYVVLKDRVRGPEVMVMPTSRVAGIEDPAARGPAAPNYWQGAWLARRYVEQFAGRRLPRDDVAMAINSVYGRSQNQLHIHVDCIHRDVKEALAANLARIGSAWSGFTLDLHRHRYRAMWLAGADLAGRNPFDLLADGDPAARADMGRETLVVAPVTRPDGVPGFVLLASMAEHRVGGEGHGESLLDNRCDLPSGAETSRGGLSGQRESLASASADGRRPAAQPGR